MGLQFGLRLEVTLPLFENKAAGELMREEVIGGRREGSGLQVRGTGMDKQAQHSERKKNRR